MSYSAAGITPPQQMKCTISALNIVTSFTEKHCCVANVVMSVQLYKDCQFAVHVTNKVYVAQYTHIFKYIQCQFSRSSNFTYN